MNISTKNQKGFTLIETLFAILIFSSALVALMTIASRGISAANSAREQTVAHYLAQEGLEIARNVRDVNYVSGSVWDTGLSQCGPTEASACKVVYGTRSLATLPTCGGVPDQCAILEIQNTYADTGTPSPYVRKVFVIPGEPDTDGVVSEYRVVSKVSWKAKTIQRSVVLQTILKKWR
jgi:prepilin-type N-terminal cleavage/methylation domain-containing protein